MAQPSSRKTGTPPLKTENSPDSAEGPERASEAGPVEGRNLPWQSLDEAVDALVVESMTANAKWVVRYMRWGGLNVESARQLLRIKNAPSSITAGLSAYWRQLDKLPPDDPRLEPGHEPS